MSRTIIFDFDGTLAIGHGPVVAYAEAIAPHAQAGFLKRVGDELVKFDSGTSSYRDGYDVVATLAESDGVSVGTMTTAYTSSRSILGSEHAPVDAPVDLAEILGELNDHARLEVATNAPMAGVMQIFESWNVADFVDRVHVNVGKPAGLYPIIRDALARGPVLAVGDIVGNDLQPAIDLGADTALVGVTAKAAQVAVTMRGTTLTELREPMFHWATT